MQTKIYIILPLIGLLFSLTAYAQIKGNSDRKIAMDQAEADDKISLNIYNPQTGESTYGIKLQKAPTSDSSSKSTGLFSSVLTSGQGFLTGIRGAAYRYSPSGSGMPYAFGIKGMAGNYDEGYNYAIFGGLHGNQSGAAIYGTQYSEQSVPGRHAGYFDGSMWVWGILTVNDNVVLTESDLRLKENIHSLDGKNSSSCLLKLNPVQYRYKAQIPVLGREPNGDTLTYSRKTDSTLLNRDHYGFVAQELRSVYPELVDNTYAEMLGINYKGLIPVMAATLKKYHAEVAQKASGTDSEGLRLDRVESDLTDIEADINLIKSRCCSELADANNSGNRSLAANEKAKGVDRQGRLYAIRPVSGSQDTEIEYILPEGTLRASLSIRNMQGRVIKELPLETTVKGHIILEAGTVYPGMYVNALMADGREVDTKKMILTE
jgi:hypothetical protein